MPASASPLRLYLHIGAGKSGSSAIQWALAKNAAALRTRGVLVLDTQLGTEGTVDGQQVPYFQRLSPVGPREIDLVDRKLRAIAGYMNSHGLTGLVISSENLINRSDFAHLFSRAGPIFQVRIIVYVRRQDDYLLAAWSQWDFKVSELPFDTWLDTVKGKMANWYAIVRSWHRELPSAPMDVRPFDRLRLVGGDVVQDFFHTIGEDISGLTLPSEAINPSLNEVGLSIARRNRRLYQGTDDNQFSDFLRAVAGNLVTGQSTATTYYSPARRQQILQTYADSNERLRQQYLSDIPPGQLFSPPSALEATVMTASERRDRELAILKAAVDHVSDDDALNTLWETLFRLSAKRR